MIIVYALNIDSGPVVTQHEANINNFKIVILMKIIPIVITTGT